MGGMYFGNPPARKKCPTKDCKNVIHVWQEMCAGCAAKITTAEREVIRDGRRIVAGLEKYLAKYATFEELYGPE